MSSQTDLDQGGTFRQLQRVYLGPSLGWTLGPTSVILPVTAAGTTTVQRGNTLVTVNVAAAPTIQLPSALGNATGGAGAVPGTWLPTLITVVDISGNANPTTRLITILPFGSETIDGLASIVIDSPYAAFTLRPRLDVGGWTLSQ